MANRPKTKEELQADLEEQIELLKMHNQTYDSGIELAHKEITTKIRVLVHDTRNQTSLFTRCNLKDRLFFSSVRDMVVKPVVKCGSDLVMLSTCTGKSVWKPLLDEFLSPCKMVAFDEWWNEDVAFLHGEHVDSKKAMKRKDFILEVANTDGGAHVDGKVDKNYYNVKKGTALGVTVNDELVKDIQSSIIRQISYELLKSYYYMVNDPYPALAKKSLCGCGSNEKYKHCCLKDRWNQNIENQKFRDSMSTM